ncbi:MAG: efflux RND transporter permease subunit [Rhodospirillales bacterium]|nr:efflux RND transporter permease subunit [Rhodospirillales bacterium]
MIDWSVGNRFFIILCALVLFAAGTLSVSRIPLDAIPDLSDTQVIIRTEWPGQAPQVMEDQVTYPLATQMLGLPKVKVARGVSMFGDSFLYVIFEDGTDLYWARSRVLEALSQVRGKLPDGADPQLGPDATGVGWVFQYALFDRTGKHDLAALRSLQDWFVRFELLTVPGVAEIAPVGGFVREYQVLVDPLKLRAYDISLEAVADAVRAANGETGGRTLEMGETEYVVRSFGYVGKTSDIENAPLKSMNGTPVTVGDVARVVEGPAIRRGVAELNGVGEVVGGIVVMRPGANALSVINAVKDRLETVKQGLPEGVEIRAVYDRSALITGSVRYLAHKLIEESLAVALVAFVFLLHVRSALVAIITLPLGILGAFVVMQAQGLSASILSLGGIAIAIGAMVDASIVMVENAHRKLSTEEGKTRHEAILSAAKEVGPGLFFALLIITVSFLPVFALTGQSYKLFAPLAFTKTYAMAAASILSVTLVPVLMLWFVRGKIRREEDNPVNRLFFRIYRPVLNAALSRPKWTLVLAAALMLSTAIPMARMGSEFMPDLDEGSLLYMPMTVPGLTPAKAREILQVTNRMIMAVPEVEQVFGKAGRADTATDPAPMEMLESWITLKPRDQWRSGMTPEKLLAELNRRVHLPGLSAGWGYPVKIRIDMLSTGIRTPVGIKIAGPDLKEIERLGGEVEGLARGIPGTRSAIADRVAGGKYVEIHPDRRALARYGVSLEAVQTVIQTALGGMMLTEAVEGRARVPVMVRYDRPFRETMGDLDDILVMTPSGAQIPLADLAEIKIADGPGMIRSEDARLNGWVFVDIQGRDIGGYVADLKTALSGVSLPPGYSLHIAGQFEQMMEANQRLAVAVPATILIIITLLYLHFGRWDRTALVLAAVPFGVVGGFWAVWLAGYHMSVAVAVGFIALSGIAVETAIVMLIYLDQQMRDHPPRSEVDFLENIKAGAALRLRPKMMTVFTIIMGLFPIFLTEGPGAEVMRRIALPMLGGMASTTVLTLILVPVAYRMWFGRIRS